MLLSGLNQVEKAISRNDQVAASLNHIFELSMLTTDYLVNYESRAERQWRSKHADFEAVLATLDVGSAEDTALLSRMKTSSAEAYRLFDEITVAHAEGLSGVVDRTVSEEYQARLTARLLIVMQEMVSDSVRLGENSSTEALSVQRNTYLLVLALALAAITIMVVIGLSTHRTIVRPLLLLRDNAQEVGRGNVDTSSGIASADEGSVDAVLVSDSAKAYRKVAKALNVSLMQVPANAKHKTQGTLHINNANAYCSRLDGWLDRFHGVATKNIPNYLAWHRIIDREGNGLSAKRFLEAAIG